MDIKPHEISLHPEWLHHLFAYKSKTRAVFNDVLGLYEISHMAITTINSNHQLLTLSSTPSLEYNLLSSTLWQWDNTYHPLWYEQCQPASWQSLYTPLRYDELYYVKQTKPRYPLGLSIAEKISQGTVIYSIASATHSEYTQALFKTQWKELLQLGQYCMTHLQPLLLNTETEGMI